jgi:hypothetical protein
MCEYSALYLIITTYYSVLGPDLMEITVLNTCMDTRNIEDAGSGLG